MNFLLSLEDSYAILALRIPAVSLEESPSEINANRIVRLNKRVYAALDPSWFSELLGQQMSNDRF